MGQEAIKLAIVARKGGVGRTPICQNLAGACSERGARILLIDQDPQASLSKNFFGKDVVNRLSPQKTAAAIYEGTYNVDQVIHETNLPGVDIVPASDHLENFDYCPSDADDPRIFALREFVKKVELDYMMVLIDTQPNAGNLPTLASWVAADCSLTVIQPTKNAVEAIADIKTRIANVISNYNMDLLDLGCVFTNVKKNNIHRFTEKTVRQLYGDKVLKTTIPSRTIFEQALFAKTPITHYKPKSDVADSFRNLLREIGENIAAYRGLYHENAANQ